MADLGQILVNSEDFKAAAESFKALIEEFNSVYNKIVSSNANLAAAWEGEAANKFREQATIIEKDFLQDIESLKTILVAKLQYAIDQLIAEDEARAVFMQMTINIGNKNVQAIQANN